ncbi:hypothetical protein AGIG_G24960 [Arapaima gigas]
MVDWDKREESESQVASRGHSGYSCTLAQKDPPLPTISTVTVIQLCEKANKEPQSGPQQLDRGFEPRGVTTTLPAAPGRDGGGRKGRKVCA